jgi:4-hydroxyphenylpyruvate dioxygenase
MDKHFFGEYVIDYVEIYTPMSRSLAYWHVHALGFTAAAKADVDTGKPGIASYFLTSNQVRLVLTATYPTFRNPGDPEVGAFISQNYCGVKRFALRVSSVEEAFSASLAGGAVPLRFPTVTEDESGRLEEASVKLYDNNEIVFINREMYGGVFKPGYAAWNGKPEPAYGQLTVPMLDRIDHIAAEIRINETKYWTDYLAGAIGTRLVQSIEKGEENKTGMILKINQSPDKKLTLVMAEPESYLTRSKVQQNIDTYGPGIHHLAFTTSDLVAAVEILRGKDVEFVPFPSSYYDILRADPGFRDIDINKLEESGILVDKEDDTYLFQKFIRPISDRPFFLYEIVQRVNGYNGFALKNINVLKKAEEMAVMKA